MFHVVEGMRRDGKSLYLCQLMSDLVASGFDPSRIFYFDFSDDRLEPLSPTCGTDVVEEYFRQVPNARTDGAYLFLDEVQELGEWQGLLRRLAQNEIVTLVVTGSSSKLSSGELSTKSRGRAHSHVLFPLSFAEFCRFAGYGELAQGVMVGEAVSRAEATLQSVLYDRYLVEGGFPGTFGMGRQDRIEVLQGYVRDVVARDVAERQGRSDIALANQLARFVLRNTGCGFSLNNLCETLSDLGYKAYWAKLNEFTELMRQAYLFHLLPEFTMQLKPSTTAVPKVYAQDQGLAYAVSRVNQQDVGKRLETAVFLELARRVAGSRDDTVTSWGSTESSQGKVDFIVGDALAQEPIMPIRYASRWMSQVRVSGSSVDLLPQCVRGRYLRVRSSLSDRTKESRRTRVSCTLCPHGTGHFRDRDRVGEITPGSVPFWLTHDEDSVPLALGAKGPVSPVTSR